VTDPLLLFYLQKTLKPNHKNLSFRSEFLDNDMPRLELVKCIPNGAINSCFIKRATITNPLYEKYIFEIITGVLSWWMMEPQPQKTTSEHVSMISVLGFCKGPPPFNKRQRYQTSYPNPFFARFENRIEKTHFTQNGADCTKVCCKSLRMEDNHSPPVDIKATIKKKIPHATSSRCFSYWSIRSIRTSTVAACTKVR
jgi:hypothetical protein